jgi:hypothetical protein
VRYLFETEVGSELEATLINDILMNGRDVMTTIYDFQAELLEGEQKIWPIIRARFYWW